MARPFMMVDLNDPEDDRLPDFGLLPALAQSGKTTEPPIPTFNVCELLSQRIDYDGKLVRIRARFPPTTRGLVSR
jgi:hypothetical protein